MKKTAGVVVGMVIGMMVLGSLCMPVFGDEWDLSEDGRYWQYYGYQDEPLKDEWIEDKGKTYYVDQNGNMKTGWVTNSNDGNRYYMGEDGAMVKNAFTPDDRYVGPEGITMEKYDTYRKAVKAEINKAARQGRSGRSSAGGRNSAGGKTSASTDAQEKVMQPYFLLADLNRDNYKDLVVMYAYEPEAAAESQDAAGQTQTGQNAGGQALTGQSTATGQALAENPTIQPAGPVSGNLVEIVVWNPEEETFQLAAEFDETGEGEYSTLYIDPNGEGIWLEITENEESVRLFQMEVDTARFKGEHSFSMELDDWGGAEYFIDGSAEEKSVWDEELYRARLRRGSLPLSGYLLVNDENMKKEIDRELLEGDLYLWE